MKLSQVVTGEEAIAPQVSWWSWMPGHLRGHAVGLFSQFLITEWSCFCLVLSWSQRVHIWCWYSVKIFIFSKGTRQPSWWELDQIPDVSCQDCVFSFSSPWGNTDTLRSVFLWVLQRIYWKPLPSPILEATQKGHSDRKYINLCLTQNVWASPNSKIYEEMQ